MKRAELAAGFLALLPVRSQEWQRVEPGLELSFPTDHGTHPRYRTEWWYLTGQVHTKEGRRFGFQFTVFRSGLDPRPLAEGDSPLRARQAFAGHLAVCDIESGRMLLAERLRRAGTPLARAAEGDLDLVLEDWSLRREPDDGLLVSAHDSASGIGLELELAPTKPLVLHGERGYSRKGLEPGNASAYVSWTRLATQGRLESGGEEHQVSGEAWFDHEFGSSFLEGGVAGWDWFGIQLDDGRELMLFELRRSDPARAAIAAGTLVESDGTVRSLSREELRIEVVERWTSPRSGARYPASWRVELSAEGIALEVAALVADAELVTTASTGVTYWEGPIEVRGTETGRGYAELTGYAGTLGRF